MRGQTDTEPFMRGDDPDHPETQNRGYSTFPEDVPRRQVSNISEPETRAGVLRTSFNVANTIIGAGIFGMPFAMKQSGIIAGIILLIAVAWLTDMSLRMLFNLAYSHPRLRNKGVLTYEDLMIIPYGYPGKVFIMVSMILFSYGCCVAYLLVVKDTVPTILHKDSSNHEKQMVTLVASALFPLPLSMMRDMANLSWGSFFNIVADVSLVLLVACASPVWSSIEAAGGIREVVASNWIHSHIFIGIGTLSFAMTCQHASFAISTGLKNPTSKRWGEVSTVSIGGSAALCIIMGISGYLGFLDETQGDIMNNFGVDSITVKMGRSLLAIHMFLVFPMESYIIRHILIQVLFNGDMDGQGGFFPTYRIMAVAVWFSAVIPALMFNDLGIVLSLLGSFSACSVAFAGPGLAYLGINGDDFLKMMMKDLGAEDDDYSHLDRMYKPWWWYVGGFPFWCFFAKSGSSNMDVFLSEFEELENSDHDCDDECSYTGNGIFLSRSSRGGFRLSMFFILFGFTTLVLGWGTTIASFYE